MKAKVNFYPVFFIFSSLFLIIFVFLGCTEKPLEPNENEILQNKNSTENFFLSDIQSTPLIVKNTAMANAPTKTDRISYKALIGKGIKEQTYLVSYIDKRGNLIDNKILVHNIERGVCSFDEELKGVINEKNFLHKTNSCNPVPNVPVDWENSSTINFYDAATQTYTAVAYPWAGGTSRVPSDIYNDRYSSDGWRLLYNFFDTYEKIQVFNPALVFYNIYRGIMRVYYFFARPVVSNNYISWGLLFEGANNSMLNFKNKNIALPMDIRGTTSSTITVTSERMANYYWYYADFEIAYDNQASNYDFSNLIMRLIGRGAQMSNVTVDGTAIGTINGRLDAGTPNPLSTIPGINFGSTFTSNNNLSYIIDSDITNPGSLLNNVKDQQTNSVIKDMFNNLLNKLKNQAVNFITNPIAGFFSSLISTPSTTSNNVMLVMDTKLSLNGTIKYIDPSFTYVLMVSGAVGNQIAACGIYPGYDSPMGVLNINTTPTVEWDDEAIWYDGDPAAQINYCGSRDYVQKYMLNNNSFQIILNPNTGLYVSNVTKALIFNEEENNPDNLLFDINDISGSLIDSRAAKEKWIDNSGVLVIWDYNSQALQGWSNRNTPDSRIYVRLIVELKRLDGLGEPVYIIKTYKPNFQKVDFLPSDTYYGVSCGS